jgi:molecular chaperone Hsp33
VSARDHLVRGLVESRGLRVLYARVTDTARMARMLHGCYPSTAYLFAEALAGGVLLGALQKDKARVNLQVECDGPLKGLFVDADAEGNVRGYVRRPEVNFPGDPIAGAKAALGRSGYLSVLRDLGEGNLYRASVELREFDLGRDLRRYFNDSEQVSTELAVVVLPRDAEPLGEVAGILVQKLPDGDDGEMKAIRARLQSGAFAAALQAGVSGQGAIRRVVGDGFELLADLEIAYRCSCSRERAYAAVSVLGREGVDDVIAKDKQAEITCEFCRQRYVITEDELRDMSRRLAEQEKGQG